MEFTRVLLAIDVPEIAEGVMDVLDRSGRVRVVASATDPTQVREALRQTEPDAIIVSPGFLELIDGLSVPVFVIDTTAATGSLRRALEHGASGFHVWPDERDDLLAALTQIPASVTEPTQQGRVTAVLGARGGAGGTFVATHLADALFRRSDGEVVLIDGDLLGAGTVPALGAIHVEGLRTTQDLLPVLDELTPQHVADVFWEHPHGFSVVLPPRSASIAAGLSPDVVSIVTTAASGRAEHVVLDLPQGAAALATADRVADDIVVVLPLDVPSFARCGRILEVVAPERVSFIVNFAVRSEVTPADVVRVFGRTPIAIVPADRRIREATDHGRLMSTRTRVGRCFETAVAGLAVTEPTEAAA